jgi:hypothetical protein
MPRLKRVTCLLAIFATILVAFPVWADWCLQLDGTLSGDLGFFRFTGIQPRQPGQIVNLAGRVAGLGPAYGTATVNKDGTSLEVGVTFFADAEQGQFDIWLQGPSYLKGDGYAGYGAYGTSGHVTAKRVLCSGEP